MKSKMILPMTVLFTMVMFACSQSAEAVDIGVSVGGSSGRHYRGGSAYTYRTADPVYTTWYPETTTYVYTSRPTYYSSGYSGNYVYSTQSNDYNGWYGSGRSGRGSNYGSRRSNYYNRR